VECVFWRLKAIGKRDLEQRFDEANLDPVVVPSASAMKGTRRAYFREAGGMVETPLYLGLQLHYGNIIEGPAVIVEPTTTIAIQPTYVAEVTKYGNYLIKHGDGRGNGKRC
jgi:N-methylhydantoinase A